MKILNKFTGFVNQNKFIQGFLTLYMWGKRINSHWNNLVTNTGSKYDILRVPLAIFMVTTVFLLGYLPANAWAVGTAESHNIWVAYTVGDVSFVHSVLRAVSMIMYGDGGVIQGAYRLACLLGIIWIIVKGIFSKQVIDVGSGFFVIFFYMCFFVPQSTLHIEDLQTKKYYTMEKIPLGVSVTLSVVSHIGKYFSDSYEAVFVEASEDSAICAAGSMNCNGYMGTLDMMAKARSSLQNHAAYIAINKAMCNSDTEYSSCDIERSILNYTKDCTVQKLMSPAERFTLKNVVGFKVNDDTQKEMRFNSERHYTQVYAGVGKDRVMTCKDAGIFIAQALDKSSVKTTIYRMAFPIHNLTATGGAVNDGGSGVDNGTTAGMHDVSAMQSMMDSALGGLGGSSADSYEYLKNVLIRPLMEKGLRDGFVDQNQLSAQIALDTAISQRNLQLAAESSMFATMVRPLTTFLEGFVLALTPIMPFILLLGLNTFGIVMKYLLVLFWIQLWAPALAICNMYVQSVAREHMALALAGTDITSFTGIDVSAPVIQHWLAVGGMMGASVPVLTLFILTGSIYTFNTLATSIKGGDHFDEKAVQPDAIKRAAYMNTSVGSYNVSSGGGSTEDGTSSAYATLSASQLASVTESAAHSEYIAKQNELLDSVIHGMSCSNNVQHNRSLVKNLAKQWQSKDSESFNKVTSNLKTAFSQQGVTLTDAALGELAVMGALAAKGYIKAEAGTKASVGTPSWVKGIFGADAEAYVSGAVGGEGSISVQGSGGKKWTDSEQSTFAAQVMDNVSKQLSGSEGKAIEKALAEGVTSMDQDSLTKGFQSSDAHNTNNAYHEAEAAEDRYSKVKNNTTSYNRSKSYETNELAKQIVYGDQDSDIVKRNKLLAWMDKNQSFTAGIINSSYGKGKARNLTGATASLIEYATKNDNDKEAKELLNIMQLDDYLGKGITSGVDTSNNLKVNPINKNGNNIDYEVIQAQENTNSTLNNKQEELGTSVTSAQNNNGITLQKNKLDIQYKNKHGTVDTLNKSAKQKLDNGVRNARETYLNANGGDDDSGVLQSLQNDVQNPSSDKKQPTPNLNTLMSNDDPSKVSNSTEVESLMNDLKR